MNKFFATISAVVVVAAVVGSISPSYARNPLKSDPPFTNPHGGTTPPGGTHPPGGTNPPGGIPTPGVFTFTDWNCSTSGYELAYVDIERKNINDHAQFFAHLFTKHFDNTGEIPEIASCKALLYAPTKVQQPFKFQLLGGDALTVNVVFYSGNKEKTLTFEKPSTRHLGYTKLINLGNNEYGIPVGSGSAQVPLDAMILYVVFQNYGAPTSCHSYDSNINNFVMGSVTSQLDTKDSYQHCGWYTTCP